MKINGIEVTQINDTTWSVETVKGPRTISLTNMGRWDIQGYGTHQLGVESLEDAVKVADAYARGETNEHAERILTHWNPAHVPAVTKALYWYMWSRMGGGGYKLSPNSVEARILSRIKYIPTSEESKAVTESNYRCLKGRVGIMFLLLDAGELTPLEVLDWTERNQ
jgi:hypothetical protein